MNQIQIHFKFRIVAANLGVLSFLSLPTMVFIGDYQYIEQPIVNFGFFVMTMAYLKNHIYQSKKEDELLLSFKKFQNDLNKQNLFEKYELTSKEMDIATLILQGYKYKDIAQMMFISEKTVSKHASNTFKKAEVANRKEFEGSFKSL